MRMRWIELLIILTIVICLPILLDWIIFANNIPSHLSNGEWAGFLGGYIGSIIGAVVSLCGIVFTIKETNKQNQKDRALQVRPYCLITDITREAEKNNTQKPPFIAALYNPKEENETVELNTKCIVCYVKIKNIGIGPAIDLQINWKSPLVYGNAHREGVNDGSGLGIEQKLLASNEELVIPIGMYIPEKWFDATITVSELDRLFSTQYENCIMNLKIKYRDMLENSYEQEFQTITTFSCVYSPEKVEAIHADMRLNKLCKIKSEI